MFVISKFLKNQYFSIKYSSIEIFKIDIVSKYLKFIINLISLIFMIIIFHDYYYNFNFNI